MAKQLTQEEYQKILSLPKRTFRIGGMTKTGLFDEESRKFYELDGGNLTGKVATVSAPAPKPKEGAEDTAPVPDKDAEDDEGDENADAEQKKRGGAKMALIIGGIVLGVVVIVGVFLSGFMNHTPPAGPDVSATDDPSVTMPAVTEIHVMKVTKDLLPGHKLTPDDVEEVVLSKADYDEVALFGRNLYTWNNLDKLVGNYLAKFVPAEQYLEQNDVQAAAPFAINPWSASEMGTTLIRVPVSPDLAENLNFGYGSTVDLTVRKVTSSEIAVGGDEPIDVPGLTHTTTVGTTSRTEEFTISGLHICDLINADGESIYEAYCAYVGIPLGNRLDYLSAALSDDEGLWDKLTPAYATIRVTDQQNVAIGDLNAEGTTAVIHADGTIYTANNDQAQFASEAAAVKTTLFQAKAFNEEKLAQERAEIEKAAQDAKDKENREG